MLEGIPVNRAVQDGVASSGFRSDILSMMPESQTGLETGSIRFVTTETWSDETGQYEPDVQVSGGFEILDAATGRILSTVAVEVSQGRSRHLLNLWEVKSRDIRIGIAMANPNDVPVEIKFRVLLNPADPEKLTTTITLAPGEQISRYVGEYFDPALNPDDPNPEAWAVWQQALALSGGDLYSTLEIESTAPIPVTALRSDGPIISNWDVGPGRAR